MNAPGKSPSVWRVVVIAGSFAVLASAMTPASAAPNRPKETAAKKQAKVTPAPARLTGGGGGAHAGPLSLEWRAADNLRP